MYRLRTSRFAKLCPFVFRRLKTELYNGASKSYNLGHEPTEIGGGDFVNICRNGAGFNARLSFGGILSHVSGEG